MLSRSAHVCREIPCGRAVHLDLSRDDRLLLCGDAPGLRIWDLEANRLAASLAFPNPASATFSPDGTSLIASSEERIREWRFDPVPAKVRIVLEFKP